MDPLSLQIVSAKRLGAKEDMCWHKPIVLETTANHLNVDTADFFNLEAEGPSLGVVQKYFMYEDQCVRQEVLTFDGIHYGQEDNETNNFDSRYCARVWTESEEAEEGCREKWDSSSFVSPSEVRIIDNTDLPNGYEEGCPAHSKANWVKRRTYERKRSESRDISDHQVQDHGRGFANSSARSATTAGRSRSTTPAERGRS
ncbi:MAG: hypothetical protein QM765_44425 [Myxococcales bacterium]